METEGDQNVIKPASQVRAEMQSNEKFKQEAERVLKWQVDRIEESKLQGLTFALYTIPENHDREIRQRFLRAGYTFRPIGVQGGVWQHGEYICW